MEVRYVIVPEITVKESASLISDDPNNAFALALKNAKIYRKADMTPVYILDQTTMILKTVAAETWGRKLH